MKWCRAKAYRRKQTGIDELHNPISVSYTHLTLPTT